MSTNPLSLSDRFKSPMLNHLGTGFNDDNPETFANPAVESTGGGQILPRRPALGGVVKICFASKIGEDVNIMKGIY
jgi:hypothetical protein